LSLRLSLIMIPTKFCIGFVKFINGFFYSDISGGQVRQQFKHIYEIVRNIPIKHMRELIHCYFKQIVPTLQIEEKIPERMVAFYGF